MKKSCGKSKPWFNCEIKKLCKNKYKADRNRKNAKLPHWKRKEQHLLYKTLRKEIQFKIKHAKIAYHDIQIQHLSTDDSRTFWSELKRLFDYKKNSNCHLISGNKKYVTPLEKANLFNETFTKISSICKQDFQEESKFHEDIETQTQGFLEESKETNHVYNQKIRDYEIEEAIRHFNNNRSPGNDGIPAEFYKAFPECWGLY